MTMLKKRVLLLVLLIFFLAITAVITAAPDSPTGGFAITWWTVDAGGGTSSHDPYALSGTIGQADAGQAAAGSYVLVGGFWNGNIKGIIPGRHQLHLPAVLSQ
jgi:hypothetical protein